MYYFKALKGDGRNAWRKRSNGQILQVHWDIMDRLHIYVDGLKGVMNEQDAKADNWEGGRYIET